MQFYILMVRFSECQNYQNINESDRNMKYSRTYGLKCDDNIGPVWFRFEGVARDESGNFMYALLEM